MLKFLEKAKKYKTNGHRLSFLHCLKRLVEHTNGNSMAIMPYVTRGEKKRTGRTHGLPAESLTTIL